MSHKVRLSSKEAFMKGKYKFLLVTCVKQRTCSMNMTGEAGVTY